MGYTKDAVKGVSWITLLRVSTRIITFVRLAILGRLLTPAQFGFFGIATLLLSLLEILTETGINVFLIQEKKDLKDYINSAWVVSIARGIILSGIIVLLTPYIVTFFNAPEAYSSVLLMAVVPLLRGFINPAIVTYQKDLLFQKEFRFRFILFLVDVIISVVFAFITRDATSFVYGLIFSAAVEVFLSYALIPHWPRFEFHFAKLKHIISRGWWVTLTGIFVYFADNGDNIVVGRILGSGSLGIYQIAYKFSTLPISEVTSVVNQVVFPVYTRFSAEKARLWKAFIKVTVLSSMGGMILGSCIYLLAEPITLIFMGDQWALAIPVIKVLALYGILRSIFGNFPPLFLAVGKQEYAAQMTFIRLIGVILFTVPLVMQFGMVGAGYAMLISMFMEIPVAIYFAHRIFKR